MTQHVRNLNAILPTSRGVRDLVWLVLLALVPLTISAEASAADKSPKPIRVSVSRLGAADDLDVEIHVLSALKKTRFLDRLSVHVANGVAHLLGPVPSADLKKKAVEIAGQVPGVLEVRTEEVYFAKPPPAAKPLILPLEGERPTQTRSASPNSFSGSVETPTARDPLPPPAANAPRVTLMAPEAVAAPPRASEPAVLTANPRTASPPPSIAATIDRLRQADRRFRSIRTEVQGSTVRVFSGDTPGAHVMAFAQTIRRLPGVQHVILKDTSTRPN